MLKQSDPLDSLFAALADPSRRSMIDRLSSRIGVRQRTRRSRSTMSLPAVQQHLNVLEASGIVSTKKIGRVRSCALEPDVLNRAQQWIAETADCSWARCDSTALARSSKKPTPTE